MLGITMAADLSTKHCSPKTFGYCSLRKCSTKSVLHGYLDLDICEGFSHFNHQDYPVEYIYLIICHKDGQNEGAVPLAPLRAAEDRNNAIILCLHATHAKHTHTYALSGCFDCFKQVCNVIRDITC